MPKRGEVQSHRMVITEADGKSFRAAGDLHYLMAAARKAVTSRRVRAPRSRVQVLSHPDGAVLLDWQGKGEGSETVTLAPRHRQPDRLAVGR